MAVLEGPEMVKKGLVIDVMLCDQRMGVKQ